MPRNILQDVMSKDKRSIRHVPLPTHRHRNDDVLEETIIYEHEEAEIDEPSSSPRGANRTLWVVVGGFLLLLGVALGLSFRGASVAVTPKVSFVTIDQSLSATQKKGSSALLFETISLSKSDEILIPADTEKRVSEKARGIIVIYNNFSEKPQRLINKTRFENEEGLIYRIDRSIVVPGMTKKDGKTLPGSIEATIFADSPGEEYNIPPSDFTIPGFKSDPARFKGFFARSKTPIAGGLQGLLKTPSEASEHGARMALREKLQSEIVGEIPKQTKEGYLLYQGAIITQTDSLPIELLGDKARIKEKVTGVAYVFEESSLARAVAEKADRSYSGSSVEIPNLDQLHFSITRAPENNEQDLFFKLKGSVHIVGTFDGEKLRSALLGRPKSDLASLIAAFPTVEKVDVIIRPFWSRSFPENPRKVEITRTVFDFEEN